MKGGSYVERSNHILAVPSDPTDHGKENTEDMAKLMAQGYELLDPGRYVLEVL